MNASASGRIHHASTASGDLRRIIWSVAISSLGTWSYNVGIAVYAFTVTHSTAWVAGATVGRYLPALALTWYVGRWSDRFPRRTVAVVADLACLAAMVLLTLVALVSGPLLVAIGLAALSSGASRIQGSTATSMAADVVVESQLVRSTLLTSTCEAVGTAVGPAIATLVLAVSTPAALFALNGLTFAASAALIFGLRDTQVRRPARSDSADPSKARIPGYRETVSVVWPLLVTRTLAACLYGADVVLLAVLATERLRQGTGGYGLLLAAAGVGGLSAAVLLRRHLSGIRAVAASTTGIGLYALPLLFFDLHTTLVESLLVQLLRGFGCVMVTSAAISALQRLVPSAASAPVFSLTYVLVLSGTCAGAVVATVLLDVVGLAGTLLSIALAASALQLIVVPALTGLDRKGARAAGSLDPRLTVLRQLAIFHDASRSMLLAFADNAETLDVTEGREVVVEGDVADALYVIVAGRVEVTAHDVDGPIMLRTVHAPGYFGEIGLIHRVPRTATVTAITPCTLWRIPAETFYSVASQAGLSHALTDVVRIRSNPPHPGSWRTSGIS